MATKKRKAKKQFREASAESLSLRLVYRDGIPRFYSNYAQVSHTPSELCIDFCTVAPPFQVEGLSVEIPIEVRVMVPPRMAEGLIKALQDQLKKQKQTSAKGALIIPEE